MRMNRFQVGDRVVRRVNVYDESSRLMHGLVSRIYSDYDSQFGSYPELYEVAWDHKPGVSSGFLRHGLDLEGAAIAAAQERG